MQTIHTQRGFAVSAAIGIIALLTLIGGSAYVATQNDAKIDFTNNDTSTTNERRGIFGIGGDVEIDARSDAKTNTTTNAAVETDIDKRIDVGLDNYLQLDADAQTENEASIR